MTRPFDSIYSHGFVRLAACVPRVRVADPAFNAERTIALARRAAERGAVLVAFPELGLAAYTGDDLFHQQALLGAVETALERVVVASRDLGAILVVGAPLRVDDRLFNCGIVVHRGQVLGAAPKSYLPNYREFYEKRYFSAARDAVGRTAPVLGAEVPFGADLLFDAATIEGLRFHVELCEDLWIPIPPSTYAALSGALVLVNLSASNITIGKADYRRRLAAMQSAKCLAAYLYSAAGPGESTTDLAWDGHAMVYENGDLLAESERFGAEEQLVVADVDLERLGQDRLRTTSFIDAATDALTRVPHLRRVTCSPPVPVGVEILERAVPRFPYVPADPARLDERCGEAYHIQVHGLGKRLESTGVKRLVIGVSGGLDSTQALLVSCNAVDRLELPRANILAYTMPGFATSERTLANARALMKALGVTASEIDIRPSCLQMLKDIGHPYAQGKPVYDVAFENVQAGERTSHLFRLANQHGGLVVGTGDLSELALGWCTYGVGDQMSHYNVNASVPKTLIQHLIRWVCASRQVDAPTVPLLQAILDTEISPELVPGPAGGAGPAQRSEDTIGPYELQDFNLYYLSRFGYRPSKVAFLALHAWRDVSHGGWPPFVPIGRRRAYDLGTIARWLEVFLVRFFQQSQFKRSAMPNAPKVGSGGSLSPRSDWRAPSDAEATAWVEELRANVPLG